MLYHINDTHGGVVRSGGTTPFTSFQLRKRVTQKIGELLQLCEGGHLLINGDLLDTANIPLTDLLEIYQLLVRWVEANPDYYLFLSCGNHDIHRNTATFSSFQFLCKLLESTHPDRTKAIFEPLQLDEDIYVIPHMPNQDLFNEALKAVPKGVKYLFLHCNYDNKFAMEADHSLNLSPDQARELNVERIIIAHEHQRRTELAGKVLLPGNQIPSSVADCLGNDVKYMLAVHSDKLEWLPVWEAEGDFIRLDWRSLEEVPHSFVRIEGTATAAEASDVASAISRYRNKSKSLVITNAVKIEGVNDQQELALNAETMRKFDVLEAVMELLNEEERAIVRRLMDGEK